MPKMDRGATVSGPEMMVCRTHHTGRWWTNHTSSLPHTAKWTTNPASAAQPSLPLCLSGRQEGLAIRYVKLGGFQSRLCSHYVSNTAKADTRELERLHREDGRILVRLVLTVQLLTADCSEARSGDGNFATRSGPPLCPWQEPDIRYPGSQMGQGVQPSQSGRRLEVEGDGSAPPSPPLLRLSPLGQAGS